MQDHRTDAILNALRQSFPGLMAAYLFGSQAQGTATAQSDWDVAVLVDGKVDPVGLWELSSGLADIAGRDVDLLDMRRASTVMQYQILQHGRRIWHRDGGADLFEAFVLSEKTALDEARAALLDEIGRSGQVYAR